MLLTNRASATWLVIGALLVPAAFAALQGPVAPPVPSAGVSVPVGRIRTDSPAATRASSNVPVTPRTLGANGLLSPSVSVGQTNSVPLPSPSQVAGSPEILAGWDALRYGTNGGYSNGWVPPDVIVSAGPTYVVEMVNLLMGVYTKSGTPVNITPLASLFASGGDFISDPKVQYDAASGRWFATVTDIATSSILMVVSSSSDPTASWHRFVFSGSGCLDQPILGVGSSTVIVSANVFSSCTSSSFVYDGAQYWVINKADLLAGAASPATYVSTPDVTELSIHPAQIEGTSPLHYMISTYWPGTATTSQILHLFTVSGTPPATVTVTVTSLLMPTAAVPPPALQLGSRNTIDTADIRISDAVWSAGRLWFGFDEACQSTASRACIRLGEISTSNDTLLQDFDIDVAGKDVFYPGLRTDGAGDLAVVFGYSSSADYPGIMVGGRLVDDAPNTLPQMQVVAAGTGPESPASCKTTCRYGDYFGAGLDPTNASVVWLAGEIGTPSGWSTHVFSIALKSELAFAYRVTGGGTGYTPPVVSYVDGGKSVEAPLSAGSNTFLVDPVTQWTISPELPGSSTTAGEIWILNASANPAGNSGWANTSFSPPLAFDYVHQFAVSMSFAVVGGGAGASPQISAVVFGAVHVFDPPATAFLDAGSSYSYPTALSGSTSTERWVTPSSGSGSVSAATSLVLTYYHQVLMTFEFTVQGETPPAAPEVHYSNLGAADSAALNATVWADSPAAYAYDASLAGAGPSVRWGTGANGNGTVTSSQTISVLYREQFRASVVTEPSSLAAAVNGAGWYDVGASTTLTVAAPSGWRFDRWSGDASGTASSVTLSVQRPLNVTAVFDPGLTITAGGGGSIAYSYGATSGTVPAGSSVTIYVPLGTVVTLTASASSPSQAFVGWSGAATGTTASTTVQVNAPGGVVGNFGTDLVIVGALSLLVVAVILGVVLVLIRRRRPKRPSA